ICEDLNEALPEQIRDRIYCALDLPFSGTSLLDIIVEIELLYSNLRPDGDGVYHIHLLGEIWSATEDEVFAFRADRLFPDWDKYRIVDPTPPQEIDRSALREVLSFIEVACGSDWLKQQLIARKSESRSKKLHPLLAAYQECLEVVDQPPPIFRRSHSMIWLCIFARTLRILENVVPFDKKLTMRLRDPGDCLSLAFEARIMAAFHFDGANVVHTDESSGECEVRYYENPPFHIECKRKVEDSVSRRDAQQNIEVIQKRVFELMEQRSAFGTVVITSRYDPTKEDITTVMTYLETVLVNRVTERTEFRQGKLTIEIGPEALEVINDVATIVSPRGLDFAFSEGTVSENGGLKNAKVLAWRSEQTCRWVRSAISTLTKAADQLPPDEPSVVYTDVPGGDVAVAWLRCRVLAAEIEQLFTYKYERLSAVVVSSEARWFRSHAGFEAKSPMVNSFVAVIQNPNTRNPLPEGTRLFGREFQHI
ncbi:MAG: hypothetical protein JWM11_3009, partial [Planctomycetaceae bacterium]|nr:hypothetical protein [Planctomycetaceae bacterium]